MRDAVIVEAVRTPLGRRQGGLSGVHPADLSAVVLRALADRTSVDPALIDDVIWGCVGQIGEQTYDIARTSVLSANWPDSVPGTTVDRQCGSSQQAVHFAAAGVIAGQYDLVVAGGVESMSRVPIGSSILEGSVPWGDKYMARYGPNWPHQATGAQMIVEQWGLSRARLDEFALTSHEKAAAATDAGRFATQTVPVEAEGTLVTTDEGIRRSTSLEQLAVLGPAFREGGAITAGNSSQISDGAAALLITTSEYASRLSLRPLARVHTAVLAGADPTIMLTAPIPATKKALVKAGLNYADIGAVEINEAFASVVLAWQCETEFDQKVVNPNGGAIALGHPLGASGARLMTDLVYHMAHQGIRYGLQVMCEGGGQANATILESVG